MTDQAFEAIVHAQGDAIYRVALHALRSPADAEDVVQTVLLELYRRSDPFQSDDHARHWLFRVTVNQCRKILRAPWRKRTVPLETWDGPAQDTTEESEVLSAVLSLPPKYATAVYLYYYEDCAVREVAHIMGAKESTVQTWLHRAREKLKTALSSDEKEGSGYVRHRQVP